MMFEVGKEYAVHWYLYNTQPVSAWISGVVVHTSEHFTTIRQENGYLPFLAHDRIIEVKEI